MRLAKFMQHLNAYFSSHHPQDPQALPDVGQALVEDTPRIIRLSIWIMLAFAVFLVGWAAVAEIDEVVHATGKTVSQSQRYRVQAQETGELSDMYIREGQIVNVGEPLMRLEHVQSSNTNTSDAGENKADKLSLVVSPVRGIIRYILVDATTGQISPGRTLVEITPLDDKLLIEARVRLQDMAFLRPGQEAMMTFTAYDDTTFGGLKGYIDQISQDMVTDQAGNSFYLVRLRTEKNYLGSIDKPLLILPGMAANVNIITGRKTLLSYLLKPIRQARAEALRER
ncbi:MULTISPECIES: HlyD family efflux transporter periplasmic adaptor subunit [Dickeya]|uniref:Hemolysin secretion protein D n=1 Tax=Dickeya fangzhongdai TaxID=1778540 RepID=A0A2K8QPP9_9GAMM|nr:MULTISPECIES: HlyD family efflux transporter periplasmic adaptor subunit [Dickeya]ATZ95446.1 hemolysin secretion protein D [Dickeya fangzhongdai]AYH49099.1 hemolysin secretion protein D [Dickeya fangzhongdai]MBO8136182.1 HlyD family efflux transporter periplasmic adaptor subunit [Dickeya fangzhongdai]QOH48888.1 HlyD family efflux transporter periplasmic adaptor subunit [Dickeya fangzhongdai]QOH53192.1 HlyD family efflux transporter periplasmic adaptor subunit [Dickeya fangzhongdai]